MKNLILVWKLERETAPFSLDKYLQESTMNSRINDELMQFINKLNLPTDLSYLQLQEIALYAAYKLEEQKKKGKPEKIMFNPSEKEISGISSMPAKSDANMSHQKYRLSNRMKKK